MDSFSPSTFVWAPGMDIGARLANCLYLLAIVLVLTFRCFSVCSFLETGPCAPPACLRLSIAKHSFEFLILLPLSPKCSDYLGFAFVVSAVQARLKVTV